MSTFRLPLHTHNAELTYQAVSGLNQHLKEPQQDYEIQAVVDTVSSSCYRPYSLRKASELLSLTPEERTRYRGLFTDIVELTEASIRNSHRGRDIERGMRKKDRQERYSIIPEMARNGAGATEISKQLHISRATVYRHLQK